MKAPAKGALGKALQKPSLAERTATLKPKLILEDSIARLAAAGVGSPRLDAELLLAFAAAVSREALFTKSLEIDEVILERFTELVSMRASRMPLAYILGRREFYSLKFKVSPEVLIPRPETEIVVTAALEVLASRAEAKVIDLATGSGAIALAIVSNAPQTRVVATDISTGALEVAASNSRRMGLDSRLEFRLADCWRVLDGGDPLPRFDVIVANPPYIADGEVEALAPEVRDFEPRLALAGGPDGLDFYRRIALGAGRHLTPSGVLIVEVGEGQAADVAAILHTCGFGDIVFIDDLAGIRRVVKCTLLNDPDRN